MRVKRNIVKNQDDLTQIWALVAIFAIPAYVLFFSSGNFNWMIGINQLYNLESLYLPEYPPATNPHGGKIYPYMPIFAIINGLIAFPGYLLITIFLEQPAPTSGSIANIIFVAIGLIVTGFWSYAALISIPYFVKELFTKNSVKRHAVIIFLFLPPLWFEVFSSGANSLVALLTVVGIYFVKKQKWVMAGVAVGLSMFKFNGLPLGIVLLIYAIWGDNILSGLRVVLGGIISQIPNIVYFAVFPEDLFMIIRRGGALTTHGHTIDHGVFLNIIGGLGLAEIYIALYPMIVVGFGLLGGILSVKSSGGLVAGMATGFFSTSFILPGEQRTLTFVILLIILILPLIRHFFGKIILSWVIAISSYSKFIGLIQDSSILGLTSSKHIAVLGIDNGMEIITTAEYVSLVLIFIFALYLLKRNSNGHLTTLDLLE
jgi:hypothetical protein